MRTLFYIAFFFAYSCTHKTSETTGKVTIIKQWHPSSNIETLNIESSKKIPHFQNQYNIYEYLVERIKQNPKNLLIVEGCESGQEIDSNFQTIFNGWSMSSLGKFTNSDHYGDIITSLPMKLKAKFPEKITALCGDNDDLIKKKSTCDQ